MFKHIQHCVECYQHTSTRFNIVFMLFNKCDHIDPSYRRRRRPAAPAACKQAGRQAGRHEWSQEQAGVEGREREGRGAAPQAPHHPPRLSPPNTAGCFIHIRVRLQCQPLVNIRLRSAPKRIHPPPLLESSSRKRMSVASPCCSDR